MKKMLVVVVLLLFVAAPVLAADTVTLKAKNGDVTFNHKVHGEKAGCKACHPAEPPGYCISYAVLDLILLKSHLFIMH